MNTQNKFIGTGVAITTPFNTDLSIDSPSLEKHIEHLISNGINYLIVLGTTGEAVTLFDSEKEELITFIKEKVNNRIPIVLGLGGNNTQAILNKINETDFNGIDAILSVAPYYNKPTQEGIYQHFKAISETCPIPIILYNVPGRTSSNINAETTLRLAKDFKNIVAIKEASGDLSQAMYIIKDKPKKFIVLSGEDNLSLPLMSVGVSGVISVVANAYPKEYSSMVQLALQNNFKDAEKIQYQLLELIDYLFLEGNPAGIKEVLSIMNITKNNVRLPLVTVSKKTSQKIKELVDQIRK
ncbi:MAG: 4-hydroxy-tetrahydrodipicolinate synthase [Bacteroidales bacterium]|jgi:4-hydroxy-tetrahydrodipicolinate synthase|nr:4-hydroxy-tetrahydrodipicolinate synthase [Bacteroidales bacterium]